MGCGARRERLLVAAPGLWERVDNSDLVGSERPRKLARTPGPLGLLRSGTFESGQRGSGEKSGLRTTWGDVHKPKVSTMRKPESQFSINHEAGVRLSIPLRRDAPALDLL